MRRWILGLQSLLVVSCVHTRIGTNTSTSTTHGSADRDGDGIVDAADKCPEAAEDRDAFEDDDGCPDDDNDRDGVPDAIDRCPNEPMVMYPGRNPSDGQGCPDDLRPPVLITPDEPKTP